MPTQHSEHALNTPALVLGSSITVLGAIRALGRREIPVSVRARHSRILTASRYYRPAPEADPNLPVGDYLDRTGLGPVVLVPCGDRTSLEVARLVETGRDGVFASVSPAAVQARLIDKGSFADLLKETGTPHPRTLQVGPDTSHHDIDAELLERAFVKPSNSQAFFDRFRVKALRPGSGEDLDDILRSVIDEGFEVIIQEYVPGPASNHYFVDGFADRDGTVRARFVRQRLRMDPPDFGNSSYMRSVPPADAGPAVEALEALIGTIGYRGPYSAEFKKDERDGVFRLLEINARPWWYVEFAARSGVDVIWMAYRDALGEPVDGPTDYPVGRTLVYPAFDFTACTRAVSEGRLTRRAWAASWMKGDRPVFAWDDPMPAAREIGRRVIPALSRRLPWRSRPDAG